MSQEAKLELRRLLPLADSRSDEDAAGLAGSVHAPQNHQGAPGPLVVDISYPDGDDDSTDSSNSDSDSDIKLSEGSPPDLFSDSASDASDKSSMLEPEPEHGDSKRRRCD